MKNIIWINWQWICGVWSTKFLIETSKQFETAKIINFVSENWNYINAKNFEIDIEQVNTTDIYNEVKDEEVIFINSFPNNKSTIKEIDLFYNDMKKLSEEWVILIWFNHFNTLNYLNKMPKILYWINLLDIIYTFNKNSDFWNIIKKLLPWKYNNLKTFSLPYDLWDFKYIENKEDKIVYMWRYASFKNPEKMLNIIPDWIKWEYHWCGRTIETKQRLLNHEETSYRNIRDEDIEWKVNVRGKYKNKEWLEIMKWSKFAFSWFKLKAENYGERLEYAMCEMVKSQCVCIFSKHFLDNVELDWNKLSSYKTFLWYNFEEDNSKQISEAIIRISKDDKLRKELITKQYNLVKRLHNPSIIVWRILKNIWKSLNQIYSYEEFIKTITENSWRNIDNIQDIYTLAIEPADMKLRHFRRYYQDNTRLRKEIIN